MPSTWPNFLNILKLNWPKLIITRRGRSGEYFESDKKSKTIQCRLSTCRISRYREEGMPGNTASSFWKANANSPSRSTSGSKCDLRPQFSLLGGAQMYDTAASHQPQRYTRDGSVFNFYSPNSLDDSIRIKSHEIIKLHK